MSPDDFEAFSEFWSSRAETQAGRAPSDDAIDAAFEKLERFEVDEIRVAVDAWTDTEQWMPRPANVVRLIEGELPSDAVIVELAQDAKTPLGVAAWVLLGSADLATSHWKTLESRVGARRQSLEDYHRRALVGDLTEIEIRACNGRGVDCAGPLAHGVPGCRLPYRAALRARAAAAGNPPALENASPPKRTDAQREAGRVWLDRIRDELAKPTPEPARRPHVSRHFNPKEDPPDTPERRAAFEAKRAWALDQVGAMRRRHAAEDAERAAREATARAAPPEPDETDPLHPSNLEPEPVAEGAW